MPIFEYRGLNKQGKNTKGMVDADNLRSARVKLKKDGIFVVDLKDKKKASNSAAKRKSFQSQSVSVKDLSLMTRQLATLVKANIPLVDALAAISEQVENAVLKEAVTEIKNMVNEGSTFNKSLGKFPSIFDHIFVSMCEAGEMTGTLDTILLRLAEFKEAQADLQSRVRSALTYPVIMLVVSLGLLLFLFTYLIPQMTIIFESLPNLTLPWYSQVVIDISIWTLAYWYIMVGGAVISVLLFLNWKKTKGGRVKWDEWSLKIPLFGEMARMVAVSRFTRTLATLLTGGVPMLQALSITRNVVANEMIARAIDDARGNISEGESISGPLKKSNQFPPLVIHMVSIGEKTGDLENMLVQVSNAYDFQVKNKIDSITAAIGPFMLVFMGLIILLIVISIIVPMFDISSALG